MSTDTAAILLHPIRLRIVLALGSDELTTAGLAARLPDIAQATLYRQVAALVAAGLLRVVDEQRVRGGVERTYALVADAVRLGSEDVAAMSADQHMRGFVTFVGSLIEAFARYLADPAARPADDPLGYRQAAVWVDGEESARLADELRAVVAPYLENRPADGRRRVLLSSILIPDLTAEAQDPDP